MARDMTTHLMLDDVNVAITESHDAPAFAVAGYINGKYRNWDELCDHYKGTKKRLLSIAVTADAVLGAEALDIESGDATIAQAAKWVKATAAAGRAAKDARYYPKVYIEASEAKQLLDALAAAGIPRSGFMLWSAHYTGQAHICGPDSCGYPQADGTQYTDRFAGVSLDGSMCYGYFFMGAPEDPTPKPVPEPQPVPAKVTVPDVVGLSLADAGVELGLLGLDALAGGTGALVTLQSPTAGTQVDPGSTVTLTLEAGPKPPVVIPPPIVVPPKPRPTLEPVLGYNPMGHGNPHVKLLQKLLNEHRKWGTPPLLVEDGHFGSKTLEVVRKFQQERHLRVDGIVGPDTWEKLGPYV